MQAGPVGAGGARWNMYRQAERLDAFQPLVHTVLLPEGVKELTVSTTTWVRGRGLFGTRLLSRHWESDPREWTESLAG